MENDYEVRRSLKTIAGKDLYILGTLDRMKLASIIFNDRAILEKVNFLVHPIVFNRFTKWVLIQEVPYVIMEAAILFESGASKYVDRVATVVAPVEQRVKRVIHRSKLSREQVVERIKNQMDDDMRIKLSDYVINNSENDMIIPAILKIHDDILKLTKS
jgi:dephospho-CoA kinase